MNTNDTIEKIKQERDFQRTQEKEFGNGVFKSELLHSAYKHGADMLDWVLKLLEDEENDNQKHYYVESIPIEWLKDKIYSLGAMDSLTADLAKITLETIIRLYEDELKERKRESC